MKYCASHMADLGAEVRRRGLWRFVDELNARRFAVRWVRGSATKDEVDPLVIPMLEIYAKSMRLGMAPGGGCPLCHITLLLKDHQVAGQLIKGHVDIAHRILVTNGRIAA